MARNSYLLPYLYNKKLKIELFRFFENFCHLNLLDIILIKSSCNFFSCCKSIPYIFRKILDFNILPKNFLNQLGCIILQTSIIKKQLSYEANFFLRLDIPRASQLVKSFCLVLIMHVQLFLDKSDSKILQTEVTQEKIFFAYGYTSTGVTNQCSFFKVMPRHAQRALK